MSKDTKNMTRQEKRELVKSLLLENKAKGKDGTPYEVFRFDLWMKGLGSYVQIDSMIESVIDQDM